MQRYAPSGEVSAGWWHWWQKRRRREKERRSSEENAAETGVRVEGEVGSVVVVVTMSGATSADSAWLVYSYLSL